MLLAVSPASASIKESVNTMTFGVRMRGVELGPTQVREPSREGEGGGGVCSACFFLTLAGPFWQPYGRIN